MRDKFIKFMYGRYGMDPLGKDMLVFALLFSLIGMVLNLFCAGWYSLPFSLLSLLLLGFVIYRTFSRNINKRVLENHRYLNKTAKLRNWFRFQKTRFQDRKTYRYVKCPKCKNYSRVPKGKGKVKITCRSCRAQFERKV